MNAKFEDFLQEQLQNPEFKKEYEALQSERAIIQTMIDTSIATALTPEELSKHAGMALGDISKLENRNANPSIHTL